MRRPKTTYVYRDGYYVSSSKRSAKKRIVSLPAGYRKDFDGVYRFSADAYRSDRGIKSNPSGGRKLTKLQKKVKAARASAKRRVAVALAEYLKQENPGRKIVGARVRKGKGGTRTITPIFAKKGKR